MNPRPVLTVRYSVSADPRSHRFRVVCRLDAPPADLQFRLPTWLRGSYLIRDFSKHVIGLRARLEGGSGAPEPLVVERLDKGRFAVPTRSGETRTLCLDYEVYAYDSSVRKAFLDHRRGFFNGSSLFYCPAGYEGSTFEIELQRPEASLCPDWKVATSLSAVQVDRDGFGLYAAPRYEVLIDHPVEMAPFQRIDFEVDSIPHSVALSGRCTVDGARLANDLTRICSAQRKMFGGEPALDHYWFLTQVTSNGYGGLEHRASTALVTARDALPRPGQPGLRKGYRGFLGLASHEYFHLWNVKRITPARFAESDLRAEAYTQDLWVYEGATSYYDDLFLLRGGIIDAPAYLDLLAESATRLQRTPGRRVQTLADSSFETWIKYYQPDENAPNQLVSYYVKGALAALCLDLRLRRDTSLSLDDVMRALWQRYGRIDAGVPEGAIERIATELSGLDLKPFFDWLLRSTDELPLAELLADFGIDAQLRVAAGSSDEGGRFEGKPPLANTPWLGMLLRGGEAVIANVLSDSPAERAGLAGGDVLVALDGLRITAANWGKLVETLRIGEPAVLHYFRGDELYTATMQPVAPPQDTWTLNLTEASGAVLERRRKWLGM